MTKSSKIVKREQDRPFAYLDDIFESFRKEMESALRPWQSGFKFPALFDEKPDCLYSTLLTKETGSSCR